MRTHYYFPTALGNGHYRGDYNARECGWDSRDCLLINVEIHTKYPGCMVGYPEYLGDGTYNTFEYNQEICGYDDNHCLDFNAKDPNCTMVLPLIVPALVDDGECNPQQNIVECRWDGGDCKMDWR